MAEFDTGVAVPGGGSFAPVRMDFGALADLPEAYFKGQQMQQKLAQQRVFRNGIPKDVNTGLPDYYKMSDMLARTGAPPSEFLPLTTADINLRVLSGNDAAISGVPGSSPSGGGYEQNLYNRESGNNPSARAKTSSAGGLAQFTD